MFNLQKIQKNLQNANYLVIEEERDILKTWKQGISEEKMLLMLLDLTREATFDENDRI
jgi:hypothetical protein